MDRHSPSPRHVCCEVELNAETHGREIVNFNGPSKVLIHRQRLKLLEAFLLRRNVRILVSLFSAPNSSLKFSSRMVQKASPET